MPLTKLSAFLPGHQSIKTCENTTKSELWNWVGRSSSFLCGRTCAVIKMLTPTAQIAPRLWSQSLQTWLEVSQKNGIERDRLHYSNILRVPTQHRPSPAPLVLVRNITNTASGEGFGQVAQESPWVPSLRRRRRGWLRGSNTHSPSTHQVVSKHLKFGG